MSEANAERLRFVLVPGMDADRFVGRLPRYVPNVWFAEDAQIWRDLSKAFPKAHIVLFPWSRTNTQGARNVAANNLVLYIGELRREYDRVVIIAHSHGGNVAMQATQRTPGDDLLLVTLGTPFVEVRSERSVERIGILFVLLYSMPLIVAVLSFSYFAAVGPTNRSHPA